MLCFLSIDLWVMDVVFVCGHSLQLLAFVCPFASDKFSGIKIEFLFGRSLYCSGGRFSNEKQFMNMSHVLKIRERIYYYLCLTD